MDDTLRVNFGALENASQSIHRALRTLEARLREIDDLGRRLTATWSGESKEAYAIRQANWQRASEDLALMLNDIKRALDLSLQRYAETEARNRAMFPPQG